MLRLNDILDKFLLHHPDEDTEAIKRAYIYSAKVHSGQVRKSGEPYLVHPLEVAGILADLKLDSATVCTGLLHDTVEDTLATIEDIEEMFGADVRLLVDGVTKLSKIHFSSNEEKFAENFRKMLVAMGKDIRVIIVKLADRLHNMRTLEHMRPDKQERIAMETLDIYAPLANRLGIGWIKTELEDLSFKYAKPQQYKAVSVALGKTRKNRNDFIEKVVGIIKNKLVECNLKDAVVMGRPKNLYSIHKKMFEKNLAFEDVHDLIAFRVIVDDLDQVYAVLGFMHALWRPIPGRFKDYVSMPKPNLYQSLHTTVLGPEGDPVEIQVRTHEMHRVAEDGIAAHWKYKEGKSVQDGLAKNAKQFVWLKDLMKWQKELQDPGEFLESVKVDLFGDEVFVVTPQGDVMTFPRGATPVDFAYAIHSEVGARCAGAKIGGKIVPLRYQLRSGDRVEVITSAGQRPNKDWLSFVKTSRAKNKIRATVRQEQRRRSAEIGRELLEKEFKRFGTTLNKEIKSKKIENAFKGGKYGSLTEMFIGVGYGKIPLQQVIERTLADEKREKDPPPAVEQAQSRLGRLVERVTRRSAHSGVKVEGIEDMLIHYAKCCNPVPGDEVIGYVTRGRGVTVHRRDCAKARELDPERRVDVNWDSNTSVPRLISIEVVTDEREGMLASLSATFSKHEVNISQANCRVVDNAKAINTFEVSIKDLSQLRRVVKAIEGIKGVHSVVRVQS